MPGEIASSTQLRLSLTRWALVTVPGIVFLGFLSGMVAGSGETNRWFATLVRPAIQPPGWLFGVAWTILYALMGLALAVVLDARRAPQRGLAIGLFAVQLALNLAWSPVFFAGHHILGGLILIVVILIAAAATTLVFFGVRKRAGWLMLPYLAWLCFATLLNYEFYRLNPDGGRVVLLNSVTHIPL